jgi:glucosamine 6-phosphate synthetase-like amidotransferase/phosphosugar isomerase protein
MATVGISASIIEEIKARGGKIIAVIARGDEQVRRSADFVIEVPVIAECLPIVVRKFQKICWMIRVLWFGMKQKTAYMRKKH